MNRCGGTRLVRAMQLLAWAETIDIVYGPNRLLEPTLGELLAKGSK